MSDFLIIAGHVVEVAEGTFKENPRERGGSESRSYNGALLSTVRWEKRSWSFSTGHMLQSDANVLIAAIALDQVVAITGAMIAVNARVTLGETTVVTAETDDTNNWVVMLQITMREV